MTGIGSGLVVFAVILAVVTVSAGIIWWVGRRNPNPLKDDERGGGGGREA